jgi:delta24(24(1))-sterol reductase
MATQRKKAEAAPKVEQEFDDKIVYEFGGPAGVLGIMLFAPCMMYFFYACLENNNGRMLYPNSFEDIGPFFGRLAGYISHAAPSVYGFKVYVIFCLFEAVLAWYMPGPIVKGLPIPSENNRQLEYRCNGVSSFYATAVVAFVLHNTGVFPLTDIIDNWGTIMTAAIICANLITVVMYLIGVVSQKGYRMSGNAIYDLFMGAFLNPRIGRYVPSRCVSCNSCKYVRIS